MRVKKRQPDSSLALVNCFQSRFQSSLITCMLYADPPVVCQYHTTLFCGSIAAFYMYISPLNPCIGDVDVLGCQSDQLTFIDDHPVLPNHFSGLIDAIRGYQIEPYERYPGFVKVRVFTEINFDWDYKIYGSNCRPAAKKHST